MTLTDDLRLILREHRKENRIPTRIENGKQQAAMLAEEWSPKPFTYDPVLYVRFGITPPEDPEPLTAEQVYAGGRLYGVPLVGVGDDHLAVTAEER